jgi:hypothetical protein
VMIALLPRSTPKFWMRGAGGKQLIVANMARFP